MLIHVRAIKEVRLGISGQGADRTLLVAANGTVNTSGWKNPQLAARYYIDKPADGILDFDFLADSPTGIVLQVVTDMAADTAGPLPQWLKGVRIHAATNNVVAMLDKKTCRADTCDASAKRDDLWPWPW